MNYSHFFFALVVIIGVPAEGSSLKDYCRRLLGGPRTSSSLVVEALPRIESLDLPPKLRRAVRQMGAPIRPYLRGRKFSFTGYSPAMKLHPAAMGEGLQSHFVAKLIRAIEPSVELRGYDDIDSDTNFIMIHDPWQGTGGSEPRGSSFPRGEWEELVGYHSLAMPLLKAANALYSNLPPRNELRRRLNISENLKIVSLYVFRMDINESGFSSLIEELQRIYPFDVAILSDARDQEFLSCSGNLLLNFNCARLSEVKVGEIKANSIILNDTLGWLPHLNRIADLAVVQGPIDFLAPLQVGTPVLVVNDEFSLRRFHRQGYERLRELAELTGAALFAQDLSRINSDQLDTILGQDHFRRPFEISIWQRMTPLDMAIRSLKLQVRAP